MKQSGIMTTITEVITENITNVKTGAMVMVTVMDMVGKNKEAGKTYPLQKARCPRAFLFSVS